MPLNIYIKIIKKYMMTIQSNIESVTIQTVVMEYGPGENNVMMVIFLLHQKAIKILEMDVPIVNLIQDTIAATLYYNHLNVFNVSKIVSSALETLNAYYAMMGIF